MASESLKDLEGWFIADMWSPLPVTPECLSGIENMNVIVDCVDTVAEHFFGQAGCDRLQKEIVGILRDVGVESDPERMRGVPADPGLMVTVKLEEEDEMVQLFVGAAVVIGNDLPSGAKAADQPDHGKAGKAARIRQTTRIVTR